MSYYFKNLKPGYESEGELEDEELLKVLSRRKVEEDDEASSDDELSKLSFDAIKRAEAQLEQETVKETPKVKRKSGGLSRQQWIKDEVSEEEESSKAKSFAEESFDDQDSESSSEEEGLFEEEIASRPGKVTARSNSEKNKKKKSHAPSEQSSKKRVPRIRKIPGLEIPQNMNENLYQDIRFDKSLGKSEDYESIRKRYKFLDEYRQKEINELTTMLKDRKFLSKISDHERDEMEKRLTSMRSRLQSLQNRDLDRKILKDYESEINKGNKTKYHLKESEKRKVIQKYKFDHMKAKQREKVMDRKRKKRRGKEFKQFTFHDR